MLKLADIYLNDDLSEKLIKKLDQYNQAHKDEKITVKDMAEIFLEYGIRYLDISAIE